MTRKKINQTEVIITMINLSLVQRSTISTLLIICLQGTVDNGTKAEKYKLNWRVNKLIN